MKFHTTSTLLLTLCLVLAAGTAGAADFPERQALEARSASAGLGIEELHLLTRDAGPGPEAMAEELLGRFSQGVGIATSGTFRQEAEEGRVVFVGDDGWFLSASGDGTRVSYRNYALLDALAERHAQPLEERFSNKDLEALGRAFVAQNLEGLVDLGAGEELAPSFTEFMVTGGGSTAPGAAPEQEMVRAATVVFSRTVGGVAVVGPGSKVAVTFANDGTPVGFDADWAPYRATGSTQQVLDLEGILGRSVAVQGNPNGEQAIDRIECGYFDVGGRKRDPKAVLQAGCYVQTSVRMPVDPKDPEAGSTLAAFVEAVPAGAEVEVDNAWPAALAELGIPTPEGAQAPEAAPSSPAK